MEYNPISSGNSKLRASINDDQVLGKIRKKQIGIDT